LFWLIGLFISRISMWFFHNFYIFIRLFVHMLHYLNQVFISSLWKFIQVFIHVRFNFIDHSFKFFVISFTIISFWNHGDFDLWKNHIALILHISYASALGFVHLRASHWLEVLITFRISVEVFSNFWQYCVVTGLSYSFSLLDWGYSSVAKHLPSCQGHQTWCLASLR
jgi:hypothetical protein